MKETTVKDLRIGNMVNLCFHHKAGWFTAAVTAIYASSIDTDTEDGEDGDNREYYYEGIPLSEEWLIKFGFVLIDENPFPHLISLKYWVYDGVCLFFNEPQQDEPSWLLGVADQRMGAYHLVTIRWIDKVHEIQNAYFGIKGRELKLA